ncbi:MAG: hypothetical protein RIQ72_686 [Candidatus Parcubacteria bacterium]
MIQYVPMSILRTIFPSHSERMVKGLRKKVESINALEQEVQVLSDIDLMQKSLDLKQRVQTNIGDSTEAIAAKTPFDLDTVLPEAFALVREASRRTLGQRHYDVQLIGGMIIHSGAIAEMKTGEGKTLMATSAAYLNALAGKGVHIITVNDYLSRRDAVWMGQIYHALGMKVGVINADASYIYDPMHVPQAEAEEVDKKEDEMGAFKVQYDYLRPVSKQEAYAADITYGTNSEFGFDYLRDNLERSPQALRQREFNFVIVDEVDSILIDEARTPLIISAASADSGELYVKFAQIVRKMEEGVHYTADEKYRSIAVTDAGIDFAEQELGISNIYSEGGVKYVHHLENAIRAKAIYKNEVDYIVRDGEVMIVDPATGRIKAGHRWSEGLHQAIEAKEGAKIQQESRTQASITYQNYFKLYPKLAGMTGTGFTSKEEFAKVYDVDVVIVPTHRPVSRIDRADLVFKTEEGKFKAVAKKIKELYDKGQPVLVGTVSIEKSQQVSTLLERAGVPHKLLNAKPEFAEKEGEIVAQAGKRGAVTIATNMAGRGVDIKLGGVPATTESYEEIKSLGGLYVIGTERHEARRIDNQLRGRSGRQGDPGETQFYVSLEDYLMRNFAGNGFVKNMMDRLNIPDDMPIETRVVSRSLETAQTKIEGWYFDSRKHVFEFDNVLNHQRLFMYAKRKKVLIGKIDDLKALYSELLSFEQSGIQIHGGHEGEVGESDGDSAISTLETKKNEIIASANQDEAVFFNIFRAVLLQTIDTFWIEHLETMDHLRGSVNLRAYGQRDPLVEYKREGHRLFKEMESAIQNQVLHILASITQQTGTEMGEQIEHAPAQKVTLSAPVAPSIGGQNQDTTNGNVVPVVSGQDKVGRNDLCPCGSGKKYKKCHGI